MSFAPIIRQQSDIEQVKKVELINFNLTMTRAASALGLDRRTVKKRLLADGTAKPKGRTAQGFNEYFLGDIARICFASEQKDTSYSVENLGPKDRADHFMSEKRELEVLSLKKELIPYDEASKKFAEMGQSFARFFDTFIDDLEQTQLFTVEQLEQMQNLCDDQRIVFAEAEF